MKLTISQPEPAMTQQTSQGTESQSRIAAVAQLGQQIWLDTLSRQLIESGTLARWIHEDAVAGLTSNPAIFHQALSKDAAYQPAIAAPAAQKAIRKSVLKLSSCPISRPLAIFFCRSGPKPRVRKATSVLRSPPRWPMMRRAQRQRQCVCGKRLTGQMP